MREATRSRELSHDAHLYRAYERAVDRLKEKGAVVTRVVLDYELKRDYQRFLQDVKRERRQQEQDADGHGRQVAEWAASRDLPVVDGHVHFPDVRVEYERPDGERKVEVFLRRHAELLRALPAWSVQLLVPVQQTDRERRAQRLADIYEEAFHQEFGTPLDPVTANELRWFWETHAMVSGPLDERRVRRARRVFGTPRFRALRRVLELDGHRAVDVASSRGIADAIERADGRLERHEMRRQYFRLSHLVGSA